MFDLLVIVNNYLHDLATGVLFAAGAGMLALVRRARAQDPDGLAALRSLYPTLSRIALGALVWVLAAGVPRTIFFSRYEWDFAEVRGLLPVLAVKHVLLFSAVAAGIVMWRSARRMLRDAGAPDAGAVASEHRSREGAAS